LNSRPVPRLYLVTDRAATGGRPLPDVVAAALAGARRGGLGPGEVAVQLREKDLQGRALRELAGTLREITRAAGVDLMINDRVDVAVAAGADGVHLSGTSLSPADARAVAPGLRLAMSAHAPADLDGLAGVVDFAVFGPIRDTPSKRRFGAPVGLAALAAAAALGIPLIAIGGLTAADAEAVFGAGARGLACIRPVMSAKNPEENAYGLGRALAGLPGRPAVTWPHRT
jgi:thiamine-phosphate pyrophosphorylase